MEFQLQVVEGLEGMQQEVRQSHPQALTADQDVV